MGFSISWYAVPEKNANPFVEKLGLTPTGETEEIPESLNAMAKLDTGWRVFWHNEYDCPFLESTHLATLSLDTDVVLCRVEEHVMSSSAELWCKGKRQWWLSHEGENGPKGLDVDGSPPEPYATIRKQMEQQQLADGGDTAEVDYLFEIPLEVAKSLVGLKRDEICPRLIGNHFDVMSRVTPKSNLLFRLFGRK